MTEAIVNQKNRDPLDMCQSSLLAAVDNAKQDRFFSVILENYVKNRYLSPEKVWQELVLRGDMPFINKVLCHMSSQDLQTFAGIKDSVLNYSPEQLNEFYENNKICECAQKTSDQLRAINEWFNQVLAFDAAFRTDDSAKWNDVYNQYEYPEDFGNLFQMRVGLDNSGQIDWLKQKNPTLFNALTANTPKAPAQIAHKKSPDLSFPTIVIVSEK